MLKRLEGSSITTNWVLGLRDKTFSIRTGAYRIRPQWSWKRPLWPTRGLWLDLQFKNAHSKPRPVLLILSVPTEGKATTWSNCSIICPCRIAKASFYLILRDLYNQWKACWRRRVTLVTSLRAALACDSAIRSAVPSAVEISVANRLFFFVLPCMIGNASGSVLRYVIVLSYSITWSYTLTPNSASSNDT